MTLARLDRRTRGVMRRRCLRSLFFRTSLRAILYTFVRRATVQPSFYTLLQTNALGIQTSNILGPKNFGDPFEIARYLFSILLGYLFEIT